MKTGSDVDETSRHPLTDSSRQRAASARWPLLARLPDVATDPAAPRSTRQTKPGAIEYRFDPPQVAESGTQSTIRNRKSEIESQPHVFERRRAVSRGGIPRRESPILPHSNPFSIPRTRLIDSLAPAVRFVTMVALFTAAGIWIQMMGREQTPSAPAVELPKTAAQLIDAPAKNAADHTVPAPTATGPIETNPQSGTRVGRANGDDISTENKSAARMLPLGRPAVTPPHFLVNESGHLPRVQTTEPNSADDPNQADDQSPSVARYPGFTIEVPTR